jgi:hypothetical protein
MVLPVNRATDQAETEREVFAKFLNVRGIDESAVSYESREPSEPDILSTFSDGEKVAFELGEMCDTHIAETLNRRDTNNGQGFYTSDPSEERVRSKLSKTYETLHPIELLLHWEGRTISTDDMVVSTIKPILEREDHVFRRVWYLGEQGVYLVYESHCQVKAGRALRARTR